MLQCQGHGIDFQGMRELHIMNAAQVTFDKSVFQIHKCNLVVVISKEHTCSTEMLCYVNESWPHSKHCFVKLLTLYESFVLNQYSDWPSHVILAN